MDDLEHLIRLGKETKTLDYKGPGHWDEGDKKACCEIVKDVLALANSGGGFIVIGVTEGATGFALTGVSEQMAASFETTRFANFLQNYADPPINCTIVKKRVDEQLFVVVEIPPFGETPHLCQKDFPGVLQVATLYVRTDKNESAPVRSSADCRAVIQRAVRNQGDRLLESMRAILTGSSPRPDAKEAADQFREQLVELRLRAELATRYNDVNGAPKHRGFREAWSHPSRYDANRLTLAELRAMAQRASGEYRGWPFLVVGSGGINPPKAAPAGLDGGHSFTDFANQERADFWHLGYSGLIFQRVVMWEESYSSAHQLPPLLDVRELAMYSAEALACICNAYQPLLPPDESVTVNIRVLGTNGRQLANLGRGAMPLSLAYVCALPNVTYVDTRSLADWRAGVVDHVANICDFIFQRFNWTQPNLSLCRKAVEDLFARRLY